MNRKENVFYVDRVSKTKELPDVVSADSLGPHTVILDDESFELTELSFYYKKQRIISDSDDGKAKDCLIYDSEPVFRITDDFGLYEYMKHMFGDMLTRRYYKLSLSELNVISDFCVKNSNLGKEGNWKTYSGLIYQKEPSEGGFFIKRVLE